MDNFSLGSSAWYIYIINKEIKNSPSALLSYLSTWEFLRTREKRREARAKGFVI